MSDQRSNFHNDTRPLFSAMAEAAQKLFRDRPGVQTAIAQPPENAALLAYRWGAPVGLVERLIAAESEISILRSQISSLLSRLAALESKSV